LATTNEIIVLHLIDDLIGPEAFQPMKQLVERSEFVGIDATNLLHRGRVLGRKRCSVSRFSSRAEERPRRVSQKLE
jgi:hypothetical protein